MRLLTEVDRELYGSGKDDHGDNAGDGYHGYDYDDDGDGGSDDGNNVNTMMTDGDSDDDEEDGNKAA